MLKLRINIKSVTMIMSIGMVLFCGKLQNNEASSQDVDGVLSQGTRVIEFFNDNPKDTVRVYRGDALEMQFLKRIFPTCTIPSISSITSKMDDSILYVKFTASDTGLFPVIVSSDKKITMLKVVEYKADGKVSIKNLTGKEAAKTLEDTSIYILDVRTTSEFQEGHIPRANLIPVNELADRVNELTAYKNKPLFVYCRSGNRSAVAVQILTKQGFSNILHLRHGIKSWIKDGGSIEK